MTNPSDVRVKAAARHLRDVLSSKGKLTGCTSYLQRKMQLGYNHAARILDRLVIIGFITEADDTGERHPGPNWHQTASQ